MDETKEVSKKPKKDTRSTKYTIVINNPLNYGCTHEEIKNRTVRKLASFEYMIMGDEIGDEGTPHTHIFIYFRNAVRFSTLKNLFPEAHIEKAKGTVSQNIDYIKKSGKDSNTAKAHTKVPNTIEEVGTKPEDNRGKNPLFEEMYNYVINQGLTNIEAIELNKDLIPRIDQMDKLRLGYMTEKNRNQLRLNMEVTYIFGKTGTGKTRSTLALNPPEETYRVTEYKNPFDSYSAERVIIFDEFRSNFTITAMLNYLDIYPLILPARFNNKYALYDEVYIISNLPLEKQYPEIQRNEPNSWKAFLRRIHKVKEFKSNSDIIEYNSVEEYLNRNNGFTDVDDEDENPFL